MILLLLIISLNIKKCQLEGKQSHVLVVDYEKSTNAVQTVIPDLRGNQDNVKINYADWYLHNTIGHVDTLLLTDKNMIKYWLNSEELAKVLAVARWYELEAQYPSKEVHCINQIAENWPSQYIVWFFSSSPHQDWPGWDINYYWEYSEVFQYN